ncbi:MAG: hypothetical protein ACLTFL_18190 [Bacteroides thetaiotaomicron]|uniref:hypothetical protein n=1 Tax=Alistipes sp. TaxID=1872444 RepID=UPI00399190A9
MKKKSQKAIEIPIEDLIKNAHMKTLEASRKFWNTLLYTFFVWFCFVQLFGIAVWYMSDVSKLEISETAAEYIRIVRFSPHLLGFALLCAVALKLFRMAANRRDTLSVLSIAFASLAALLIFADRMTGCFTSVYINGVAEQMDVIQSWLISVCGMLSVVIFFRLFPDTQRNSKWAISLILCIVSAFVLSAIPFTPAEVLIVFPLGWLVCQSRKLLVDFTTSE